MEIDGLGFEAEVKILSRGQLQLNFLGFVGKNDKGDEYWLFTGAWKDYYNIALSGKDGFCKEKRFKSGIRHFYPSGISEIHSIAGTDLYTYIDKKNSEFC